MAEESDRLSAIRAEEARNKARFAIQKVHSDAVAFRKKNPDQAGWVADFTQRMESARTAMETLKLGLPIKREVDGIFSATKTEGVEVLTKAARLQQIASSQASTRALGEEYLKHGDYDSARAIYEESQAFGSREIEDRVAEVESERRWGMGRKSLEEMQAAALEYPERFLRLHPVDGAVEEGVDLRDVEYVRGLADRAHIREQMDALETVTGVMRAQPGGVPYVMREEDIDERLGKIDPVLRRLLSENLTIERDAGVRREMERPEIQDGIVGEIQAAFLGDAGVKKEEHLEIFAKIGRLVDGRAKEHLKGLLMQRVDAGVPDDGPLSRAMALAGDFYRRGLFGSMEVDENDEPMAEGRAVNFRVKQPATATQALGRVTREMIRHARMNPEAGDDDLRREAMELAAHPVAEAWGDMAFGGV